MEITEVRIKLMDDSDDRLQAFCSITFDDAFVVRDLKIIDGTNGPFVAMPSRKLTSHCPECGSKNHMRAHYCNQCGKRQPADRGNREGEGRAKLYADIAHPINSACREMIQERVIAEFQEELERAKAPGYISRYDDEYDDFDLDQAEVLNQRASGGRWDQAHPPHEARSRHIARRAGENPNASDESSGKHESDTSPETQSSSEQAETGNPGSVDAGSVDAGSVDAGRAPLKGPHTSARKDPSAAPPHEGGFGAGIFDE